MRSCSADDPTISDRNEAEYKKKLTPEQYRVTRLRGTERAFTGIYWDHKETGQYKCICCEATLFGSEHKFDSGTGWPSFYDKIGAVKEIPEPDGRIEIRCSSVHVTQLSLPM